MYRELIMNNSKCGIGCTIIMSETEGVPHRMTVSWDICLPVSWNLATNLFTSLNLISLIFIFFVSESFLHLSEIVRLVILQNCHQRQHHSSIWKCKGIQCVATISVAKEILIMVKQSLKHELPNTIKDSIALQELLLLLLAGWTGLTFWIYCKFSQ